MRRSVALAAVALMLAGTLAALVAPWPALAPLLAAGVLAMRERRTFLALLAVGGAINVVVLGLTVTPGGWMLGLVGALRLGTALAANLAVLQRLGAARLLEGLRLPPRATGLLAAILLAAHDVGRDFARLRDARRLDGDWPDGRVARAREGARLLPALVVASYARARTRREALQVAGHGFAPWFVPFVAIAALCVAGRMAFLALPNVALTYVVAFLGGVLFGPWIAAAAAFSGMFLTDLMLTGLYPGGLVNAPAMALLGLVGGAFHARGRSVDPALAGAIGVACTFLFSVAADSLTWLLLFRESAGAWLPLVVAGLVFNAVPALVNAVLFAASVGPTQRAFDAWQRGQAQRGAPRPEALASPEESPAPT